MLYTSSEAAKLLKKLTEEHSRLEREENSASVFTAAVGEDLESVRPAYNYKDAQDAIKNIETKIRKVKHIINLFNASTIINEFDMTIDQMLIYLPQLTRRKNKLQIMQSRLPKTRKGVYGNFIDYEHANYDIETAKADFIKISDELARAQTALDKINNSAKMDIADDLLL